MALNYIMLPENYHHIRRPRPGHRPKKVAQTFPPMSRSGRRVKGETKSMATAGDAREEEEVRAKKFTKFVKTLNRKVAAQCRTAGSEEADSASKSMKASERINEWFSRRKAAVAAGPSSQLSRKRDVDESASTTAPISRRAVKRIRVEISPRMNQEDELHAPDGRVEVEADAIGVNDTNQFQTFPGPAPEVGGVLYHQGPVAEIVQPLAQHATHGIVPSAFPSVVTFQHNTVLPGPPNPPFLLNTPPVLAQPFDPAGPVPNDDDVELERTALMCAYIGMGEPMDIDMEFPAPVDGFDYKDLERTAIECAYAALDEPMDTTLDDTKGPGAHVIPQDAPPMFEHPGFVGDLPPRHPGFDHAVMFQPPIYDILHPPGYHQIVDHDYRLWPPAHANVDHQPFPPPPPQEPIIDQAFPLYPFGAAEHNIPVGGYPAFVPDLNHNVHVPFAVQQQFLGPLQVPVQEWHNVQHQVIDHLPPPIYEEVFVNHHAAQQTVDVQLFDHNTDHGTVRAGQQTGQDDQGNQVGFFVDPTGDIERGEWPDWQEGEEQHLNDVFEDLFGADDEDEDDYDGDNGGGEILFNW